MNTKYQDFRWKVNAYWGFRQHEPDWTLIEYPCFDNPKDCLRHFKDRLQEGYDVADCWRIRHYLVMQRLIGERRRLYCLQLGEYFAESFAKGGLDEK